MKRAGKLLLICGAIVLSVPFVTAQNIDEARMNRDIEVAENVLTTLIKQEFEKRSFFPVDVNGSYRPGYGVTFSIPTEMLLPMVWGGNDDFVVLDGTPGAFSYSFSWSEDGEHTGDFKVVEPPGPVDPATPPSLKKEIERSQREMEKTEMEKERASKEMERAEKEMRHAEKEIERAHSESKRLMRVSRAPGAHRVENTDSLRAEGNAKLIKAAKSFIADYGDMISQLAPSEKIIVTNQGENQRWFFRQNEVRSILAVEASKGDLTQFRQGKINRDQLIAKIKVTNTESSGKVESDLELLTSIFNRLYRSDLSRSFFIEGNTYYEKLNDFGAIVYMQVYSSNQIEDGLYNMPTIDLRGVDQVERDKKVKELYPVFEKELKENILEYGRTVKSLSETEQLAFNVKLTRCKGCGIPYDIEVSVKSSVLKDYNSGKLDKNSALGKITVKRGENQ